jgi:hypothetical protein
MSVRLATHLCVCLPACLPAADIKKAKEGGFNTIDGLIMHPRKVSTPARPQVLSSKQQPPVQHHCHSLCPSAGMRRLHHPGVLLSSKPFSKDSQPTCHRQHQTLAALDHTSAQVCC